MNELVLISPEGKKVTTSLIIAEKFHKSHGKVLRDIANLSCSQEFMQANFGLHEYIDARGNTQPMYYITKDGFSFLVLGYNGKTAGEFKERFINAFNEGQEALKILDNDDAILAKAFTILTKKQKELESRLEQKEQQLAITENIIKENIPKVEYYDEVLNAGGLITTTIIAKDLGMSAARLNQILKAKDVIFKCQETWVLKQKYQDRGYTHTRTFTHENSKGESVTTIHTYWTEKGRQFIMDGIGKLKRVTPALI